MKKALIIFAVLLISTSVQASELGELLKEAFTKVEFNMGGCLEEHSYERCTELALEKAVEKSKLFDTVVTVAYYGEAD